MRPGQLWIDAKWRNSHEPGEAQVRGARRGLHQRGRVLRAAAELARFPGDIDLHEHIKRDIPIAGGPLQRVDQLQRIGGVDAVEALRGVPGLVALEVADEVPPNGTDFGLRISDFGLKRYVSPQS